MTKCWLWKRGHVVADRQGSCTQCGICCRQLSMPWTPRSTFDDNDVRVVTPLRIINPDDAALFLSYRGVEVEFTDNNLIVTAPMDGLRTQVIAGTPWIVLPIACSKLGSDNLCQVYGSDARPQACSSWPVAPWQLQTLPLQGQECGYSFPQVPDDQAKETLSLATTMLA